MGKRMNRMRWEERRNMMRWEKRARTRLEKKGLG